MIGLYGHRNIDDNKLREWVLAWDEQRYVDYVFSVVKESYGDLDTVLRKQIQLVKSIASMEWDGEKGYFFDTIIQSMSQLMMNCYFRASSSIASVANFHEILIEPSDYYTNKCLIKGFDYVEKGNIYISYGGEVIGNIGTMSDLFWHSFYDEYIFQDDFGGVNHTRNNDQDFTLQIWKSDNLEDINELEELVEKILYDCSVKLGLNFKRAKFDNFQKTVGHSHQYSLEVSEDNNYERTPLQYFNFANYTSIGRHKYLAYYQVIEFYFIRARKQIKLASIRELDLVNYILNTALNEDEIRGWFYSNDKNRYYTTSNDKYSSMVTINLEEDLIEQLAKRVYFIRCSLVHSKEAPKDANFIPNLNDAVLDKEVALIKFLASKVLEKQILEN
ncbi:hypothetical protein [Bacillus wiedmannii]|uniref:hypothetical protein n=1 Tax=Bacillus wiedmannii TaxID=1890302 RepID=UPI000BFB6ECF|nr:hypothetical protein [Bacillus wiedmannii]PHG79763.1 hypothetical protein COI50_05305 [Bacillus wiedmannii]